jgi:ABC-2 type transport system permease protein
VTLASAVWLSSARHIRGVIRSPWTTIISLVQPIVWLLIFGSLFSAVSRIPGFTGGMYLAFLTPGVLAMTGLYAGGWNGMYTIIDIDNGLLDRLLASPMQRLAILLGPLAQQAVVVLAQSILILCLAWVKGVSFAGGLPGYLVMLLSVALLSCLIGALSNALAIIVRKINILVVAVQFLVLPLTFTSSAYMQLDLAPGWIQAVSKVNPLNWSVEAAREALQGSPNWGQIFLYLGMLLALLVFALWIATRAFQRYLRSQ